VLEYKSITLNPHYNFGSVAVGILIDLVPPLKCIAEDSERAKTSHIHRENRD